MTLISNVISEIHLISTDTAAAAEYFCLACLIHLKQDKVIFYGIYLKEGEKEMSEKRYKAKKEKVHFNFKNNNRHR